MAIRSYDGKNEINYYYYPHHSVLMWVLAIGLHLCVCLSHQYCVKTTAHIELDFGIQASHGLSCTVF